MEAGTHRLTPFFTAMKASFGGFLLDSDSICVKKVGLKGHPF
jgi:hypothetical protein